MPQGVCGQHAGHHPGPGGGAYGGGQGGNGPHGGMDGRHGAVRQHNQVHLVAPAVATGRGGAAHARRGGHSALAIVEAAGRGTVPGGGERHGPNPAPPPGQGLAIARRVGCLPIFHMREAAVGALANSVALYGVEVADVEGRTLSATDTAAAKATWGPTRCSRAKELL